MLKSSIVLLISLLAICVKCQYNRTLSVTGSGQARIVYDKVRVNLRVEESAPFAQEAMVRNSIKVNRVIVSVNSTVSDLSTTSMSLTPNYNYTETPPKLIGYTSSSSMTFTSSPEAVGEAIDNAVRAGASTVDSVSGESTNERRREAYDAALEAAIIDAEGRATKVANTSKVCLDELTAVQVNNGVPIAFDTYHTPTLLAEAISATSVPTFIPGTDTITSTVDMTWSFTGCV